MGKAKVADDSKLKDGLLTAINGEVVKATGTAASPGIFGAAKAADTLFERARGLGYLEQCEGPPVKGRSKPKYARITENGRKWVLGEASPREVLEGLLKVFNKESASLGQESEVSFLQSRLAELQHSFEQLQRSIQEIAARRREDATRLQDTIQVASKTVTSAVAEVERLITTSVKPTAMEDLGKETEAFVRQWRSRQGAGCPLPDLFNHLKERWSTLTIGGLHDLLRSLYKGQRIRLTGWHDSPDRMPDPNMALFISSKVMYYADTLDASV